jgi:putative ABC transport system permease protein
MTLLIGALTVGLLLSLLALGVYISFKVFEFPDITADGSFAFGAAVASIMITNHVDPYVATLVAVLAGCVAGALTGVLHTKFKIHGLLAGILVMTALYSVDLRVMGRSNLPLMESQTLATRAERLGHALFGERVTIAGWEVPASDMGMLIASAICIAVVATLLYLLFRTNLGTAMRATGDNPQMIRAQGVNTAWMITLGLAISNGLIALSGALLAQYQGFADVQMGIGMVVWGLASVILGQALIGNAGVGLTIAAAVIGSLLFRLMIAIALRLGLNPNDLKLVTAVFVFIALVAPGFLTKMFKTARPQNA